MAVAEARNVSAPVRTRMEPTSVQLCLLHGCVEGSAFSEVVIASPLREPADCGLLRSKWADLLQCDVVDSEEPLSSIEDVRQLVWDRLSIEANGNLVYEPNLNRVEPNQYEECCVYFEKYRDACDEYDGNLYVDWLRPFVSKLPLPRDVELIRVFTGFDRDTTESALDEWLVESGYAEPTAWNARGTYA